MPDRPGHILIVDDNRLNRLKLAHGLRQEGHTSSEAEDGRQALEMIQTQPFDLVLLDIIMPGKDGGEIMADFQRDPDLARVPIAFLTATLSVAAVAQRDNQIKGCPCIAKPISPKELMGEIETILKQRR